MTAAPENGTVTAKPSPEALLRLPVGAASPLWGLYAGAAMGGMALWLMSRWARPQNLPIVVVPGGEHFFHGRLHVLQQIVAQHHGV